MASDEHNGLDGGSIRMKFEECTHEEVRAPLHHSLFSTVEARVNSHIGTTKSIMFKTINQSPFWTHLKMLILKN